MMGVYVYIDGSNFYSRLFKNHSRRHRLPKNYKWLDLLKLSQALLPGQSIDWIGYFTAYIRPRQMIPTSQSGNAPISKQSRLSPVSKALRGSSSKLRRVAFHLDHHPITLSDSRHLRKRDRMSTSPADLCWTAQEGRSPKLWSSPTMAISKSRSGLSPRICVYRSGSSAQI